MTLPDDWDEYHDNEDGTHAFFNSSNWTGNFRITTIQWTQVVNSTKESAARFIAEQINCNKGATKVTLGGLDCAHYRKYLKQDDYFSVIYFWLTVKKNSLFICSFTIDKSREDTKVNRAELILIQNMIKSIQMS